MIFIGGWEWRPPGVIKLVGRPLARVMLITLVFKELPRFSDLKYFSVR